MSSLAPLELWRAARKVLSRFWDQFGAPTAIAQQAVFAKPVRDRLCQWLRGAETMLRALVFMEAVEICIAGDLPLPKPARPHPRAPHQKRQQDPNNSDSWRVRFRLLNPARKAKHRARKPPAPAPLGPRLYNAWPLAERAEALLRVFNTPAPYARRLARKLRANRAQRLRVDMSRPVHPTVIMPILWDDFCMAFIEADRVFCNSS